MSATDADYNEVFSFNLVSGAGDTDNSRFQIVGNQLQTAQSLDFEAGSSYSVRIRVTDSGGLTLENQFTISVTNVNEVTGFDVQQGQVQRSFLRYLDLTFESPVDLDGLVSGNRIALSRFNLDGSGSGSDVNLNGLMSAAGNGLTVDFGANGIGGNRNTNVGDGYYILAIDADGDGIFETQRRFYRLLGDVNGDRKVDSADANAILAGFGHPYDPNLDANGDGVVNSIDRTLALRAIGRQLGSDLVLDD